MWIVKF